MQLTFNIRLPEHDLQRVGFGVLPPNLPAYDAGGRVIGASMRGVEGREFCRFFPILTCLDALVGIDTWQLSQDRYSPLYESGVYYRVDPPGREDWDDIPTLYARGWGDCKKLAAARCAEYRMAGVPAVPCISWKDFSVGGKRLSLVHVRVLLPDDTIEDPSRILGMKGDYNDEV